jgi:hypothetical protein
VIWSNDCVYCQHASALEDVAIYRGVKDCAYSFQ